MYAISFRIPFLLLGNRSYVNGSALSDKEELTGTVVEVQLKSFPSDKTILDAEVISSARTRRDRDSFKWEIV